MYFHSAASLAKRRVSSRFGSLTLLAALVVVSTAAAQDTVPVRDELPSLEVLQAELSKVELDADLQEEVKSAAVKSYRAAIEFRKQQATLVGKVAEFSEKTKSAPNVDELKKELATELPARTFETVKTVAAADNELQKIETSLSEARELLSPLTDEPARRAERRVEIPKELAATRERLGALDAAIDAARQSKDAPPLKLGRIASLQAEKAALRASTDALQAELDFYVRTGDTLSLSRDLLVRRVARFEDERDRIQKLRIELAKSDAAEQEKKAEQLAALETIQKVPVLGDIANRNKELARESTKIASQTEAAFAEVKRTQELLENIESEFQHLEQRVRAAGLTNAIGLLLRQKQSTIPSSSSFRRQLSLLQPELTDAILLRQDLSEERADLSSIDDTVDRIMSQADPRVNTELVRREATELLSTKRDNLDQLLGAVDRRQVALTDLDTNLRMLIARINRFSNFISERILWVASTKRLSAQTFRDAASEFGSLVPADGWRAVHEFSLSRSPEFYVVIPLLVAGLMGAVWLRHFGRSRLKEKGESVRASFLDSLPATAHALAWTVLASASLPLAVWILGLVLTADDAATARQVGRALLDIVPLLWGFEFTMAFLHPMGLAEAHFRWPVPVVGTLRGRLRRLWLIGLPLAFFFCFVEEKAIQGKDDSLERVLFLAANLMIAVFFSRVLGPFRGLLDQRFAKEPERLIYRSRHVLFLLGIAIPAAWVGMEAFGYHYTAVILMKKAGLSLMVLLLYFFAHELTVRVVLVAHGRMARERTQARREELIAKRKAESDESDLPETIEEEEVDLYTISAQTRRLVNGVLLLVTAALLWFVWADVLPALGFLDQYSAFTGERMAKEVAEKSLSIADLLTTFLLFAVFIFLYRNIGGLLQFFLLRQFTVDRGTQYAITTIAKYAIGSTGLVLMASKLGFEWSRIQWLLAGASVGLGFGLQEIVANFVSGLILLVEQPVRVGDIVTVEGTTGVVAKIRMRATTITNWDRQDLIVPNKDLITGRILNWTLTSRMNRIVINVGIAYGSDVTRAKEILRGIVHRHPLVLEDPAPRVFFEGLGDSTLKLVLQCFLAELDNRITVIDELHMAIHSAFARAGIEIAFPQRDIHLRTVPEGLLSRQAESGKSNGQREQDAPSPVDAPSGEPKPKLEP